MIIGVPKEIKNNENRVGMTPAGVAELVKKGHTVYMQATAGINSGFSDDDYIAVGAQILPAIEDVYAIADMIVKVKEPIAPEYKLIKKGQVVFTYFHFAADKRSGRAHGYSSGRPFFGETAGWKRKTNGWRAGGTSCTRTYFRGWHRRH